MFRRRPEEKFLAEALRELEDGTAEKGIWARAIDQAQGNEGKARAIYIRLRGERLSKSPMTDEMKTMINAFKRSYRWFWWGLLWFVVASGVNAVLLESTVAQLIMTAALLGMIATSALYLYQVGRLAGNLGKSRIVYVGGTILLNYLGVLLTYYSLLNIARQRFLIDEN